MTATLGKDVLRRKASVGRAAHEARAMTPAKALRLAVEKAADRRLGLALSVTGGSRGPSDLAEVLDAMAEDGLLLLLDGPDGRMGALGLDFALLSALVEMQTVGRVLARDPDPRPTTRTDAAIVTPLVDDMLARFAADLVDEDEGFWACGYRAGTRCPDLRLLGLALDAPEYQLLRVPVDIARGLRTGGLVLALPMVARPALDPDPLSGAVVDAPDMAARLRARLLDATAPLDAVLARLTLSLAHVQALSPGDLLPLPAEAVLTARLEAGPKRLVAQAQLGQMNGRRALRLRLSAADPVPADAPRPTDAPLPPPPLPPRVRPPEVALPDPAAFDLPDDLHADLLGFAGDEMSPAMDGGH